MSQTEDASIETSYEFLSNTAPHENFRRDAQLDLRTDAPLNHEDGLRVLDMLIRADV